MQLTNPTADEAMRMRALALQALRAAKGQEIRVLEVRKLTDITDYMLIATGQSARHVRTLTARVLENMRACGWRPLGVEGLAASDWVVVDFVHIVAHIMRAEARAKYALESLWDASLVAPGPPATADALAAAAARA